MVRRLVGIDGWEVGGECLARDVGVAQGINSDGTGFVQPAAPEESGVDKR